MAESGLPPQADFCRPRHSEMQASQQKHSPTSGTSHTITGPFSSGPPCMCICVLSRSSAQAQACCRLPEGDSRCRASASSAAGCSSGRPTWWMCAMVCRGEEGKAPSRCRRACQGSGLFVHAQGRQHSRRAGGGCRFKEEWGPNYESPCACVSDCREGHTDVSNPCLSPSHHLLHIHHIQCPDAPLLHRRGRLAAC